MIDEDGLRGVTSNPAIFEKAITGSTDYKDILNSGLTETGRQSLVRTDRRPRHSGGRRSIAAGL